MTHPWHWSEIDWEEGHERAERAHAIAEEADLLARLEAHAEATREERCAALPSIHDHPDFIRLRDLYHRLRLRAHALMLATEGELDLDAARAMMAKELFLGERYGPEQSALEAEQPLLDH